MSDGTTDSSEDALCVAAEMGDTVSMLELAELRLSQGRHEDARHWYRQAAEDGDGDAVRRLGDMLQARLGDRDELEELCRRAADAGDFDAMEELRVKLRGACDDVGGWTSAEIRHQEDETWYRRARHQQDEIWYRRAALGGSHRAKWKLLELLVRQGRSAEAENLTNDAFDCTAVAQSLQHDRPVEAEQWLLKGPDLALGLRLRVPDGSARRALCIPGPIRRGG